MNILVVPKPLFNSKMEAEGYYLSYRYGNELIENGKSNRLDASINTLFFDFMNRIGLEALTLNNPIFIPVTNILLVMDLETLCDIDRKKVVLMLDADVNLNDLNLDRVKRFKKKGFQIALANITDSVNLASFFPYVDYVVLNAKVKELQASINLLKYKHSKIKIALLDISSIDDFDKIKHSGIHLFGGDFYKVHIHSGKQNAISPLKVNYIQLLNIVNQEDFDFKTFSATVRQDPALAIQFMKLVNSTSGKRKEIKSLNQAAAMVGQNEIRKWITTAVSTTLSADKPSEITRLSLLRAKFCENCATLFELGMHTEYLFLVGLFSVLDVILEMPMEDALNLVFVPDMVKQVLLNERNEYSEVFEFVKLYEIGNWHEISRLAILNNISVSKIHNAYVDSVVWYKNLLESPDDEDSD